MCDNPSCPIHGNVNPADLEKIDPYLGELLTTIQRAIKEGLDPRQQVLMLGFAVGGWLASIPEAHMGVIYQSLGELILKQAHYVREHNREEYEALERAAGILPPLPRTIN